MIFFMERQIFLTVLHEQEEDYGSRTDSAGHSQNSYGFSR